MRLLIPKFKKQDNIETIVKKTLKNNPIFKDLNFRELQILSQIVHIRNYSTNEFVFHQDQSAEGMYIILSGEVSLATENTDINEETEKENKKLNHLRTLNAGDFFGETSLINSKLQRDFSIKATKNTKLIGFFLPDLIEIKQTRPIIGMKIAFGLAEVFSRYLLDDI